MTLYVTKHKLGKITYIILLFRSNVHLTCEVSTNN